MLLRKQVKRHYKYFGKQKQVFLISDILVCVYLSNLNLSINPIIYGFFYAR